MQYYNLGEDEVVLYKGEVCGKMFGEQTQLILTNHNIVFITERKKTFQETAVSVKSYPVGDVKIYETKPQIKIVKTMVEVYLKTTELEFDFSSKLEQHKFVSAVTTLLTGKTAVERGAEKVKDTIDLVNDTLDVDIVKSAGDVVQGGLVGTISKGLGKLGKTLFGRNKK